MLLQMISFLLFQSPLMWPTVISIFIPLWCYFCTFTHSFWVLLHLFCQRPIEWIKRASRARGVPASSTGCLSTRARFLSNTSARAHIFSPFYFHGIYLVFLVFPVVRTEWSTTKRFIIVIDIFIDTIQAVCFEKILMQCKYKLQGKLRFNKIDNI